MSYWKKMTDEQRAEHLIHERDRRKRRKESRTEADTQLLSELRRLARERRKERDLLHHQQTAREYIRNGKGYFYSWASAIKSRARKKGIPCDIDADWLRDNMPTHCPVLGIELIRKSIRTDDSASSPTVDRLIPALGYVRGNIHIISRRANNIKSDASIDEIRRVAQWMQTLSQH